jgi:two-component system, chemotaxis family, chemotaxis protein CheY
MAAMELRFVTKPTRNRRRSVALERESERLDANRLPYDCLAVADRERVVLVVEDDESIRNVIADVLEERGFRVRGAANGVEALACLDETLPDVMVLDLLMPVMHGWDFMESYAQKTNGNQIPIVVVSVNAALPRSFNHFGVHSVIAKPFDVDELLSAVDDALSATSSEATR